MRVVPYRVEVADTVLRDLRDRLARTRFGDEPAEAGWAYGTSLHYLRELVAYWRSEFDWRNEERSLNELPHHRADVDGLGIHFVHQPGAGPAPLPMVLVHGWPTGFPEMVKLIPLLSDPAHHGGSDADAFDVIVPSLPGYSFSDAPSAPGYGYRRAAEDLRRVVVEGLGHRRYGLHATGAGAYVTGWMALDHPDEVVGLHTHDPVLMPPPVFDPPEPPPSPAERAFLERSQRWAAAEGAYAQVHRTKPQSLGHTLADSPAGLASWLLDKFWAWSDCGGDLETRYSKDAFLTIATIHWATGRIASSLRAYYERVHADPPAAGSGRLQVPTGVATPPDNGNHPPRKAPREMVARTHDVRHWVDLPRGGHFVSWEEPELVADSIRAFFRALR